MQSDTVWLYGWKYTICTIIGGGDMFYWMPLMTDITFFDMI